MLRNLHDLHGWVARRINDNFAGSYEIIKATWYWKTNWLIDLIDLFINHFRSHWLNYSEGQQ